jgi:hypothetical protein
MAQPQQNGKKPTTTTTVAQKLRNMLADPEKLIVCPGVYDGFTTRIALQEGADCLYMVRIPKFTHHHHLSLSNIDLFSPPTNKRMYT